MLYKLGLSKIHGIGVIAASPINVGDQVDIICLNRIITPWFGKWINHSTQPNGAMVFSHKEDAWIFVATKAVQNDEELTVNYWKTPDFIAKPIELGITD